MLTMFTALEAQATAALAKPENYTLYLHIEERILDAVQYGGTSILYAGPINHEIVDALRALGYKVVHLQYEGKERMVRISWENENDTK